MQPAFFLERDRFVAEMSAIRDAAAWNAAWRRWMADEKRWPQRTRDQWIALSARPQPWIHAGRSWGNSTHAYDLDPEARYLYFWTLRLGDPLRYPHIYAAPFEPRDWHLTCPFCEIWTEWAMGLEACPRCSRALISEFTRTD